MISSTRKEENGFFFVVDEAKRTASADGRSRKGRTDYQRHLATTTPTTRPIQINVRPTRMKDSSGIDRVKHE